MRLRPPGRSGVPTFGEYLAGWSRLHGGYRPAGWVRGYLRGVYAMARPLRNLPPNLLTAAGLLIALAALGPAWLGGRWAVLAAALVGASALADSLDGAVAVLAGRTTRWGSVLDSVADRAADLAYMAALWLLGAPAWLCVTGAAGLFLLEYARARATAAGMAEVSVVTAGERPARVLVTVIFMLCGGVAGAAWFDLGGAVVAVLSFIGLGQLLVVVRRVLAARGSSMRRTHPP